MCDLGRTILSYIGAITVILVFIKYIVDLLPVLRNLKTNLLFKISQKIQFNKFEKLAISSNVEDTVNSVVSEIRDELPYGWIRKTSIKWINDKNYKTLENNDTVIRMYPFVSQDLNLMNGVFLFFKQNLFPNTKEIIPDTLQNSAVLQISKKSLNRKYPYIVEKFEKEFIEKSIKLDEKVAEYIGKFDCLDQKGFFTSTFIRETHELANNVRYNEYRNTIQEELDNILSYLLIFIQLKPDMSDEQWYRISNSSSFGFLLVARPFHPSTRRYVNRAKKRYSKNVRRLYVMGVSQEIKFFKQVIHSISDNTRYKLLELFKLNKDYRGEKGGVAAIFDSQITSIEDIQKINEFFDKPEHENA